MLITTFKIKHTESHGPLKTLLVPLLGFQAVLKDNQIHNVEPFSLTVDERGMILNYEDRVPVNIVNATTGKATWDSMSVLSLANIPAVRHVINNNIGIQDSFSRWDAIFDNVKKVNVRAFDASNQIELEMVMDGIMKMNIEQAIDIALDHRDKAMFQRLVCMQQGGVAHWN